MWWRPRLRAYTPVPHQVRTALREAADSLEAHPIDERMRLCASIATHILGGARCSLSTRPRDAWSCGVVLNDARTVAAFVAPFSSGNRALALQVEDDALSDTTLHALMLFSLQALPLVAREPLAILACLSAREAEILALISSGCSEPTICDHLGISKHTVRTHVRHLYRRFGVQKRAELLGIRAIRDSFDPPSMPTHDKRLVLSPRQREVVALLARGLSEKEVAGELGLSAHTVHGYVKIAHRRMRVRRRAELIRED